MQFDKWKHCANENYHGGNDGESWKIIKVRKEAFQGNKRRGLSQLRQSLSFKVKESFAGALLQRFFAPWQGQSINRAEKQLAKLGRNAANFRDGKNQASEVI